MIVRIVKMHFQSDKIEDFKTIFESSKDKIRNFPGVQHLQLLNDNEKPEIFFTYSVWQSKEDLEQYRKSELFRTTWAKTKPLFAHKAEAWSTTQLHRLD